jgi:molecular chaperone GrpE
LPDEPEAGGDPVGEGGPAAAEQAAEDVRKRAASLSDAIAPPPADSQAEAFQRRARLAEDRLAEVLAAYRKLTDENEAHRARVTKNLQRRYEQRLEKLLVEFIDILDNFDRALEATEQTYAGNPLIDGLILVRTQLLQTLQDEGLERIPAIGLPFDPSHSEAVETRLVADPDQHHMVLKELLRGYRVHGRVVRASQVVVGEYPVSPAPTAERGGDGHALEALAVAEPMPEADASEPAPTSTEPSLEDIVNLTEAQEALFHEAFDDEDEPEKG